MKDADAVRNLVEIVKQHKDEDIFLVVSAMGKTTNMLEKALKEVRGERLEVRGENGNLSPLNSHLSILKEVMEYHEKIILDLFENNTQPSIFPSIRE